MANDDWSDREIDPGNHAVDRELDRLKRVYQEHAAALSKLAAAAPTKALARKYHDLIGDINRSILSLEDPGALAKRGTHDRPLPPGAEPTPPPRKPPATPPVSPQRSAPKPSASDVRLRTEPGTFPSETGESTFGRIALILGMAIIVIVLLAFFVWKFGGRARTEPPAAVETPVTESPSTPAEATPMITASPEAQDFGVIYKGTRVTKTFEVFNNGDRDLTIYLERSQCRCLWFDYPTAVPAGGRITVTVTVDAERANEGLLSEAVVIATRDQPRVATEVQVTAEIR